MPRTAMVMRKRRNGIWHSQGQGSGYTSPGIKEDAADDADGDDDPDDDLSPEDKLKKANGEAKKRRFQVKELRRENERLKAKLAENRGADGAADNSTSREDLVLGLVEAGLSRTRIRMALKLVDVNSVEDVDDAIEDLREEYPDLFESAKAEQELPGTGSRHNGMKQKGSTASNQQLINKYSALRYAQGRS